MFGPHAMGEIDEPFGADAHPVWEKHWTTSPEEVGTGIRERVLTAGCSSTFELIIGRPRRRDDLE
jgi:hypothetical protein